MKSTQFNCSLPQLGKDGIMLIILILKECSMLKFLQEAPYDRFWEAECSTSQRQNY